MTGFDETVPPDDDADRDQHAVAHNDMDEQRPEHDSKNPALESERGPDEPTAD